jgi:hypothetical protein
LNFIGGGCSVESNTLCALMLRRVIV